MGAIQSRATIRVFYKPNYNHNVHYWNYPNMPAGWLWFSAGIADYEIMDMTPDESATVEECFEGTPANIEEMRAYLAGIYDTLQEREMIDKYTITERVVEGKSLFGRIFAVFSSA